MLPATAVRRTVLYGRTSDDESEGRSVDDQLAELRRWAHATGRAVVAELRDDGISASRYSKRRKARPDWQQAMELIAGRRTDELAVWEVSRSTRDRAVWSALIAACIENGVEIAVDGKVHDPADADDGFMLDLGAALAVREVAMLSKRVRRAVESRAAAGKPAGTVPYGYRRVIDPETGRTVGRDLHLEQAPVVADIVRRLLAREPADRIAADLNERGIPTGTGKRWRGGNLRILALRPTYAGLRVHRGQVLDGVRGTWPPIISEAQHLQLVEMFADPARDKFRNPTHAKHLGTGIYRCGREGCDGRMRVVAQSSGKDGLVRPQAYSCRACFRVSRVQEPVDLMVEKVLCKWLERPEVLAEYVGDDPTAAEAAEEVARLKRKLREARQAWDDDLISLDDYADMKARTEPKIRAAEERARPRHLPAAVLEVAGPDAERRWRAQPIEQRRAIVAAIVDVVILPAHRAGGRFDPSLVRIMRRSGVSRHDP